MLTSKDQINSGFNRMQTVFCIGERPLRASYSTLRDIKLATTSFLDVAVAEGEAEVEPDGM